VKIASSSRRQEAGATCRELWSAAACCRFESGCKLPHSKVVGAFFGALALVSSVGAATLVPGITEPLHDSLLSASAAGTVRLVNVKEGDRIAADAVILELDKSLEELEVTRRRIVYESRVELEAADQRANLLKADYESSKRLFERSQSVSRDEVDKKELEYKLALAERDKFAAAKERERVEFEMAKEQLARRAVMAPFAGVITDLRIDLGEACEPRQPVVRIVDLSRAYFVANVQPALLAGLAAGRAVTLKIETPTGVRELRGTIDYVAPVVDAGSGLRRVKAIFDNADGAIAPGALGHMLIE
jgi:RND family efflux transporter MFP subunit